MVITFGLLLIILFAATIIFYIVFFSLSYYWHEKNTSFVVVPFIFTFDFFAIGFLIISLIYIVVKYLPSLLSVINR